MESHSSSQAAQSESKKSHAAMDIMPQKQSEAHKVSGLDVKEAPAAQVTATSDVPDDKITKHPSDARTKATVSHQGSTATFAIVATIIIALGLGSLMVYAYLRTNGVSIF